MWQEIIVGLCVLLAAGYLLRKYVVRGKQADSGCGSCNSCSNEDKTCSK